MQEHLFAAVVMIVLALSGTDHMAVRMMDREIGCLTTCRVVMDGAHP
jgi:hypothetical protein